MVLRYLSTRFFQTIAVIAAFGVQAALADDKTGLDLSLRHEVQHAIDKGLKSLLATQDPKGFWSDEQHPAITALVVRAILADPSRKPGAPLGEQVEKALDYIVSCRKADGGIYVKGLANYNTSAALMALLLANRERDLELMKTARRFLVNQQMDFDRKGEADNSFDGGIGYGGTYAHSDLSNTHLALEALYHSRHLVKDQPDAIKLNWESALAFVSRCQNLTSSNKEPWASDDKNNKGGFIYFPGDSKAGEQTLPGGKTALRSYGSMSYAGLLSFFYAQLDADDPRVKAVLTWLGDNYTLEENPGLQKQGLYYYYHTMSKALSVAKVKQLPLADGSKVNWRRKLALKLIQNQSPEGHWVNDTQRWWEGDRVLTTCYAVLSLEHVVRER